MADRGAIKKVSKVSEGDPSISLSKGTWTTVARFELADVGGANDPGWSILDGELYGTLPAIKPTGIESRWARRADDPEPDVTKRTNLAVGARVGWAGVVPATIEYLSKSDFPIELQVWHDASVWKLVTAIAAILSPATYIASRLTIGDD